MSNPQSAELRYLFSSGTSLSACPEWETLPIATLCSHDPLTTQTSPLRHSGDNSGGWNDFHGGRFILLKHIVPQLAKQFLRYYMNWSSIPLFTSTNHRPHSSSSWIQFATVHSVPGHTTVALWGTKLYFSLLPRGAGWEMPVCWRMTLSFFRNRNCPKNWCFNDPPTMVCSLKFPRLLTATSGCIL